MQVSGGIKSVASYSPKRCVVFHLRDALPFLFPDFLYVMISTKKRPFGKNLPKIDTTVKEMVAKLGNVLPMIVVSLLPHTEFGPNEHPEGAPYFK